jgi:hypothetical protein
MVKGNNQSPLSLSSSKYISGLLVLLIGIGPIIYVNYSRGSSSPAETETPGETQKWDSLEQIYSSYTDQYGFHKWDEYAVHYDQHIQHIRQNAIKNWTTVNILEIGVQSGGSTRTWRSYFGPLTRYIGVDINSNCKEVESENIHIEIGSQLDPYFLIGLCLNYGPFDLIVDDGGHTTEMIRVSLEILWHCMKHEGVYIVEDTHSMSMWDTPGMITDGKDFFGYLGDISRDMIVYFREKKGTLMRREAWMHPFSKHISEIAIYDSLVFLHYNKYPKMLTHLKKGEIWISDKF